MVRCRSQLSQEAPLPDLSVPINAAKMSCLLCARRASGVDCFDSAQSGPMNNPPPPPPSRRNSANLPKTKILGAALIQDCHAKWYDTCTAGTA